MWENEQKFNWLKLRFKWLKQKSSKNKNIECQNNKKTKQNQCDKKVWLNKENQLRMRKINQYEKLT